MTTININCGNCHNYHPSVQHVRDCFAGGRNVPASNEAELAAKRALAGFVPENGYFSVQFPDDKSWRTLRFQAGKNGWKGKVIISLLAGPDNDRDYVGFAHAVDGKVSLWKNARSWKEDNRVIEALRVILNNHNDAAHKAGEAYAVESKHCFRCNRRLTVPTSVHRGLGPDCADVWEADVWEAEVPQEKEVQA